MRIVHVAPVWLPVSRNSHGGIETFLAELVSAQRKAGHDVVLVAAGGSCVDVPLVEAVPEAAVPLMQRAEADDYAFWEQELLTAAIGAAQGADIVHSHLVPGGFVLDAAVPRWVPVLHTLHGQVTRDLSWSLRQRARAVVAVSESQAGAARSHGAELFGVAHNGIDMETVPFSASGGRALLFMGRMEPQKGPDIAVAAAREAGLPLVLAGSITDAEFFENVLTPLLGNGVTYAGVLSREEKYLALGDSACLLVTSRWAEPFGMVAIEAMAVGTPVVALARGALPEIVDSGVTGVVVDAEADLAAAIAIGRNLDRSLVRKAAWTRFHIEAVNERYLGLYRRLIARAAGAL